MDILVLPASGVRAVLTYPRCADAMRAALTARANGEVFQPLRSVLRPEGAAGFMALMPSYRPGADAGFGLKAICIMPGNPAAGLDSHQGIVLLSSQETGQPLAVLNASAVTEIRTAATSVVATQELARPDADVLAIVGTGVQARSHLRAIAASRPLAEVRIAGSAPGRAKALAERAPSLLGELGADLAGPMPAITACDSARDAVAGAGIVVTATSSPVPVVQRDWLAPGTHINAVGACVPHARELDTATVRDAALFCDSRESVLAESGDYKLAAEVGAIGPGNIRAELGDLLAGRAPGLGRQNDDEITVFVSLGLAVEDLAAAGVAYRAASESGEGFWTDFD